MKKLYIFLAFSLFINALIIKHVFIDTPVVATVDVETEDYYPESEDIFAIYTLEEWFGDALEEAVYLDPTVITHEELRLLSILHLGFDGLVHAGEIIVNEQIAEETLDIFKELYEIGFPIEQVRPISDFDNDDNLSMEANNTHGFNFRKIEGTNNWSKHAYGLAIDINPIRNPFVSGDSVRPAMGIDYLDRNQEALGMINYGDEVHEIFTKRDWIWGGDWDSYGINDFHHFQRSLN